MEMEMAILVGVFLVSGLWDPPDGRASGFECFHAVNHVHLISRDIDCKPSLLEIY